LERSFGLAIRYIFAGKEAFALAVAHEAGFVPGDKGVLVVVQVVMGAHRHNGE